MVWQKLSFKGKAWVVALSGVLLSMALIVYGISAVNLVIEAEQVWSDYNRTATAASQQLNRIHKNIGYGGFIHNYKNYILRADDRYLDLIDADKIEIYAAIKHYRALNISVSEREALSRLTAVVDEYVLNLNDARIAFADGDDTNEVDRQIKVDDAPALKALENLSNAALVRSQQSERETQQWLDETVAYISWGLFIVPLVLICAAVMVRFLWQTLRATQAAKDAQHEVEGLLQTAPDAMLTVNEQGQIVRANHQAQRLFGYAPDVLCTMCIEDLIPARHRGSHVASRQSYFGDPHPRPMGRKLELMGLTQDGREVPVEVSLSTLKHETCSYATATIRDISNRLVAEQQVRENEERLSLSQAIAHAGTWDWNIESNELIWSDEIYSIFGAPPETFDASYEDFLAFLHPDDRDVVVAALRGAVENGAPYDVEHRIITQDGKERYVHERGEVYRNQDGKPVRMIGVVLDITERKAFMTALETAKSEADQANQSKSEFLANMSHEIRTPMNAILGMGYLALKTDLNRQQGDYLRKMMSSARSLLRIINDILDFSKIEAGKMELEYTPFSLAKVMENVANVIGTAVKNKKLEILFVTDVDVPCSLIGDSLRLEQVLINLASNAVKFTECGEVVVRVSLEDAHTCGEADLKFSVHDTGIGMSKDQVKTLFEAFQQGDASTTRRFGGTGLGLSITLRLVNMMGGDIGVESAPDKGTTFTFTSRFGVQQGRKIDHCVPKNLEGDPVLIVDDNQNTREILSQNMRAFGFAPTAVNSGEAALNEHQFESQTLLEGTRILVVEDNLINQQVAEEILREAGAVVDVATDGDQAYRRICLDQQKYDAVLMDLQMPVMDGYVATDLIRKKFGPDDLVIIAVTANAMDSERQKCLDAGMNDFVTKPIDVMGLYATLLKWICASRSRSLGSLSRHKMTPVLDMNVDATTLPDQLDGFDLVDGLDRMLGRPELYLKFLLKLDEGYAGDGKKIRDALDRGDTDTAHRTAHTMKGVAGNLSATDLYQAAMDLDAGFKRGDQDLSELLNHFDHELQRAVRSVRTLQSVSADAKLQDGAVLN
ncbi:MAG: response regulator [Magnetovibrio sp.]|nr:response regulator [Magnetovibrio sp.]